MNRVLDKRRELSVVIFIIAMLTFSALFRITGYAAVGDVVTSDKQVTIKGETYPEDGAVVKKFNNENTGVIEQYSDGTLVVSGLDGYVTADYRTYTTPVDAKNIKTIIIKGKPKKIGDNLSFEGSAINQPRKLYIENDYLQGVTIGEWAFGICEYMNDKLELKNCTFRGSAFTQLIVEELVVDGGYYTLATPPFGGSTIGSLTIKGVLDHYSSYSEDSKSISNVSPWNNSNIDELNIEYSVAKGEYDRYLTGMNFSGRDFYDNTLEAGGGRWALLKCDSLYLTNPKLIIGKWPKQFMGFAGKVVYLMGDIDTASVITNAPTEITWYVKDDTKAKAALQSAGRSFKILTDEQINDITKGQLPTLEVDSKLVDLDSVRPIDFTVNLGKKPAGASGIKKVLIDNKQLIMDIDYLFNGIDTVTISEEFLKKLYNGSHAVSILFDNGTFRSGASIYVMGSTVPVVDPSKPPEALDTIKYEFYKDYPDYLIIPVSLNGATSVTKLKIGRDIVDPDEYYLDDGAIVISYNYLSTLDAGKYRVLPTFNDPAITTLNNIQLWVYENAADRAAPYLLQTRIIFRGQNFGLRFDAGVGDLETSNVLALVIDNQMLLPDGRLLPLSSSNVSKVKKIVIDDIVASPSEATRKSKDLYTVTPEEINTASPSEATNQTMSLMSSSMHVMSSQPEEAFYVVDNEIHVSGNAISSMKLAEGDHLMGAIFDNTEKTSDVRKVILSIMSDKDNGTETPGNNENPGNNETPGNSNGSNNGGNSGSEGNSGSGNHGSNSGGGSGDSSNGPGAKGEDSKVKPVLRDDGGSYNVNPNDPKDVTYTDKDGNLTPNKWVGDGQNWRHTNKDSKLDYGWFLDVDGSWYLLTKEAGKDFGTAWYGWFHENQDGKWYYLSTKDNKMAKGKVKIDGKDYNFNPTNQEPTYYGDNKNGWIYDQTKGLPVGCWIEDIK